MPRFTVRRLREGEWEGFRGLRLAALRTDPMAFGSTLERESAYPIARWQAWCRRGSDATEEATFVAVSSSDQLVGMVGAFTARGTLHVWGLWVLPEWRGQSVAKQLVSALLDWIDQIPGERSTTLDVNPSQAGAVHLYASKGFVFTGSEEPLGHDPPAITRQMVRPRRLRR